MNNSKNKLEIKCSEIRNILIKKSFEKMNINIIKLLDEHLGTCSDCRHYNNTLIQVQNKTKITSKDTLSPDLRIRASVIERIKQSSAERQNFFIDLWQRIWKILDFRIPVYQGIIGFAIIILIFLGLNNSQFWNHQNSLESSEYTPMEQLNQLNVLNSLKFIQEQKIGTTVKEDTMLTHFLFTAM